jgi:hypothetical protein
MPKDRFLKQVDDSLAANYSQGFMVYNMPQKTIFYTAQMV